MSTFLVRNSVVENVLTVDIDLTYCSPQVYRKGPIKDSRLMDPKFGDILGAS